MILHAVGSHYTYAGVPLGEWAKGAFGFGRNHLDVTLAFSALDEIIEMAVAMIVSPGAGDAYLGTQGDPFDGIRDMGMAFLGAIVCMIAVAVGRRVTGKGPFLLAETESAGTP
ncbi:MAG TPA: DUF2238 domain-containing protein [Bacteroidota bacterium]|nr:DUF2238 domain-containing protein [Bacteroidota bacterium]